MEKMPSKEFNRGILMNLELKNPLDPEAKSSYQMVECVEKVHHLIQMEDLAEFVMVQSFDHEVVKTVEKLNSEWCKTVKNPNEGVLR